MPDVPGTSNYPASLDTQDSLLRVVPWPIYTTLRREISATETTLPVESAIGHPATNLLEINGEYIIYTGLTATGFTGCTRGAYQNLGGAPASAHPGGSDVRLGYTPVHHHVHSEALIKAETEIDALKAGGGGGGGTGTTLIDFFTPDQGALADRQWVDMPAATTELFSSTTYRRWFDLTNATQFRLQANVVTAGAANSRLRAEYSLDAVTWADLGVNAGTGQVVIDTTGYKFETFGNLAAGAKAGVYLRLTGIGGDGVADPAFGALILEILGSNSIATGSGNAPIDATYITQTPSANLSAEQALSALATGIVKNTTGTGVLSIAVGADLPTHNHTQAQSHDSPDTDTATTALHHTLGAGANQAAAGTHGHAQLHDAATVLDTTSIDLTLTGQQVSAIVLPAGVDHNALANLTAGDPHTQYALDTDLATHAALIAAHGATGAVVGTTNTQTLTGKTLTTPTIGDLSNAGHSHANAAGGGQITDAALSAAIGIAKGGSGQTTQQAAINALAAVAAATNEHVLTKDTATGNATFKAAAGGGGGAPTGATYIVQTADATLSAEQALSALSTGLVKVTTGTGVLSTAAQADVPGLDAHLAATTAHGAGSPIVGRTDSQVLTNKRIVFLAGTTASAPITLASGPVLTTPEAGALEYDGTGLYFTNDLTNGRADDNMQNVFRLAANGAAIGPAIADYFGATSALPTVAGAVYELTFYLWYLKTTAGTVTYTLVNTQTYTNLVAAYEQTAVGGIATNAAPTKAGIVTTTLAAAALPVTGSLTTAVNHHAIIRAIAEIGTAGNVRLRVTSSAGTITPLRGSYYTARRLPSGNVGTYIA